MPFFYFHTRGDDGVAEHPEGRFYDDIESAKADAAESLSEILSDRLRSAQKIELLGTDITDQDGNILATVLIDDVLSGLLQQSFRRE